jgi:uncharacterized protein with HEPN domain
LQDMLSVFDEVEEFVSVGRRRFLDSRLHQRAVDKDLEILGEAAGHLTTALKEHHPEVDWKAFGHLRDARGHEYFSTDAEELWRVATEQLPALRQRLRKVRA